MSPQIRLVRASAQELEAELPTPDPQANKYTRGKLTVIGGSGEYPGSACLASKAGLLMGAGYVECVCSDPAVPLVRAFAPSLVVRSWEGASAQDFGLDGVDAHHPKACLIGSGMAVREGQEALLRRIITGCAASLVLDGGALRMVAEGGLQELVRARRQSHASTAMTPHGGEAAALARAAGLAVPDESASAEEQARYAQRLADAYQATILLKGPISLIASAAEGRDAVVHLMDEGTAALAKAGTGDVLAGMVGSLLAQGKPAHASCVLASTLHARAGCLSADECGIISVTAESVLEALPAAILAL